MLAALPLRADFEARWQEIRAGASARELYTLLYAQADSAWLSANAETLASKFPDGRTGDEDLQSVKPIWTELTLAAEALPTRVAIKPAASAAVISSFRDRVRRELGAG